MFGTGINININIDINIDNIIEINIDINVDELKKCPRLNWKTFETWIVFRSES